MQKRIITESELLKVLKIRRETLDILEEEGIIVPHRKRGERVYNTEQVEDILFAMDLRREMGVNWAGVEVALNMRRNIRQMSRQMERIADYMRKHLVSEFTEENTEE